MSDARLHPGVETSFDASDPEQVRKREQRAHRLEIERRKALAEILGTSGGRAWIWELLEATHMFATILPNDQLQMAYAEGERNVGLRILANIMAAAPDQYLVMQREAEKNKGQS